MQDGKLSALEMNKVSLTIESKLKEQLQKDSKWEGDAHKAIADFSLPKETPIWYVDAVLSDIYGNQHLTSSYPSLSGRKVNRKFENHRFIYSML